MVPASERPAAVRTFNPHPGSWRQGRPYDFGGLVRTLLWGPSLRLPTRMGAWDFLSKMGYIIQIRDTSRVTFRYLKLNVQMCNAMICQCYIGGHYKVSLSQVDNVHMTAILSS